MTTQQKKIHILVMPSWYSYSEKLVCGIYFKNQIDMLKNAGYQVGVITPIYHDVKSFAKRIMHFTLPSHPIFGCTVATENEAPVYRWYCLHLLSYRLPYLRNINLFLLKRYLFKLTDYYIKHHGVPDIIHAHSVYWCGYVASLISRRYQIPFVVTEHLSNYARGLISQWHVHYLKEITRRTHAFITVSDSLGKQINQYYKTNYIVIPNSVDTDFFTLKLTRAKNKVKRFVCIAELKTNKNIDLLLKAFAYAFRNNFEVVLEIAGGGPEENYLKKLTRNLKIESQVKFLGPISHENIRELLKRGDIFVLPSSYETFGVVLIEALATGLPVIAPKSGGPIDIIVDDSLGRLITPNNLTELQQAMVTMLDEVNRRHYKAKKIRDYVEKRFSEKCVLNALEQVYVSAKRLESR